MSELGSTRFSLRSAFAALHHGAALGLVHAQPLLGRKLLGLAASVDSEDLAERLEQEAGF
jgi:hypothetical protein